MPAKVSPAMNEMLTAPYEREEVQKALFQMFSTKSPDSMGFRHTFSKSIGTFVDLLLDAILEILPGKESAACTNDTLLVLIPQVSNPTLLSKFRPISLYNVFCKIASKMVANRLKMILP